MTEKPISSISGLQFFITGASRGLGLGLTQKILELNGNVVATCKNPTNAKELNNLQQIYGENRLVILPLDVTSKDELEEIRRVIRSKGIDTIDVAIANAGIASKNHPYDPAMSCPEDDLLKTFQTNTIGTLFTAQSISPLISMSKKAKLFIAISSKLGSIEQAASVGGYTSYRISKAGLNMACMCMAYDPSMMGIGIRFLCLHPGLVQTDMGSAGGRNCPLTVTESCDGMINMIQRAVDVQMFVMGSSVYEERSWQKKIQSKSSVPPIPQPSSSEPSVILKCPFGHDAKPKQSDPTSINSDSNIETSPPSSSLPLPTTTTEQQSESITKCPYSFDSESVTDESDGESAGSCPFGAIQPQVPVVSEDSFQLISQRLYSLSDDSFEKQFLQQRCVFTSYDGTMLPW